MRMHWCCALTHTVYDVMFDGYVYIVVRTGDADTCVTDYFIGAAYNF